MTEPKNALIKQYKHLFALDNVLLEFTEDALDEIAEIALKNETGARGLRAIIESFMTEIMYKLPEDKTIEKCIIHRETVTGKSEPEIICNPNKKPIPIVKHKVLNDNSKFKAS